MKYFYLVAIFVIVAGCNTNHNSHGHTHDAAGGDAQNGEQAHEEGDLSYTLFSGNYELFVEFPALIVGRTSSFAAHFTELNTYKPVSDGSLTVSIIKGNKGIRQTVKEPSSPGIFRPSLQPSEAGAYHLLFYLESDTGNVTFEVPNIQVYSDEEEAAHALIEEERGDVITFLKEQAWKTEFSTIAVSLQPFHSVIHTSGRVSSQPQSQTAINAQIAGTVQLYPILGQSVNKGELLALISGTGVDENMTLRLNESIIAFEKSKSDFLRSIPLAENQVISKKDFLDIEALYKQDSLKYTQLAKLVSLNGLKITAPADGFITSIDVQNGQYIESGNPVLTVTSQNQLLIETFVNQSDLHRVNGIFDANFKLPVENKIISLHELNGSVKARNAFVNENSSRIPVTFSVMNNGELMPGMFLEAFLFTGQKENAVVVPSSSIIEEQGHYFVFVQIGGESYVKREIYFAGNDGKKVEIQSGLKPGERIVTRGAYQIKLAALTGTLPIHGHTH
jgi:membrane fusion protein, heavy metal efflux system